MGGGAPAARLLSRRPLGEGRHAGRHDGNRVQRRQGTAEGGPASKGACGKGKRRGNLTAGMVAGAEAKAAAMTGDARVDERGGTLGERRGLGVGRKPRTKNCRRRWEDDETHRRMERGVPAGLDGSGGG